MTAWTQTQDAFLRDHYSKMTQSEIAQALGKGVAAVRNRRYRLKLPFVDDSWSVSEIEALHQAYANVTIDRDIDLPGLAVRLGRNKSNVCRKARQLGLTDNARKKVHQRARQRKFSTDEDLRAYLSARTKERFSKIGHPRGMAGKKHSMETKDRLRAISTERAASMSAEEKAAMVDKMMKTKVDRHGSIAPNVRRGSWVAGWREIGGRRNYYRSRWEANYARYLEWLKGHGQIADWEHEPETFWFDAIKRGVRSYLPDFRVTELGGQSSLHEVKGWMDARSKTILKRMAKYHPTQTVTVIRERQYNEIARKVSSLIDGWEHSERTGRW